VQELVVTEDGAFGQIEPPVKNDDHHHQRLPDGDLQKFFNSRIRSEVADQRFVRPVRTTTHIKGEPPQNARKFLENLVSFGQKARIPAPFGDSSIKVSRNFFNVS